MRFSSLKQFKYSFQFFTRSLKPKKTQLKYFNTFFEDNPLEKFYRVNVSSELKKTLQDIDETKQEILKLQSATNGNLKKTIQDKLRFLWTYNSNAIEGSKLSLGDTIFFLQEGLTVGGKPLKDFLDAQNHSEAIDYLYDIIQTKILITPYFLRTINSILLKRIEYIPGLDAKGAPIQTKVNPGSYKEITNYVIQLDGSTHQYVEPFLVPQQIEDLCQWINSNPENYHPCIISAIAHYNMVRIHPFQDGNGRGARLLMNIILMKEHFYPATIEVEKRKEYLECLRLADKGNLVPFCKFVADALQKTQLIISAEIKQYLSNNASGFHKP